MPSARLSRYQLIPREFNLEMVQGKKATRIPQYKAALPALAAGPKAPEPSTFHHPYSGATRFIPQARKQ